MKDAKNRIGTAVAGILAAGALMTAGQAQAVPDAPKTWEKCAGIAKKGMNDCGALDGRAPPVPKIGGLVRKSRGPV